MQTRRGGYNASGKPRISRPGLTMNRIIVLFLTAILLQACAAIDDSKKTISLDQSLYFYESAMRWADFKSANSLRRYTGDPAPATDPAKLRRIKVTGYEVLNTVPSDDETEVYVTARISYYDEDNLKVKSLTDNQVWQYDKQHNAWYVSTPLPVFK
jgi:hypothetical protein